MSTFAAEIMAWTLAALLATAAAGGPAAAVWRWRRHPVPSVFLVLAGFALGPWALHEAEAGYRLSLSRQIAAEVRRDMGVSPDADLRGEMRHRFGQESDARFRADPVFAFLLRNRVGFWLQDEGTRTLSWLATCSLLLIAAGCRSRPGPAEPAAVD